MLDHFNPDGGRITRVDILLIISRVNASRSMIGWCSPGVNLASKSVKIDTSELFIGQNLSKTPENGRSLDSRGKLRFF